MGFLASSESPLDVITSVFESAYIIYLFYYIADSIFYIFVSSLPSAECLLTVGSQYIFIDLVKEWMNKQWLYNFFPKESNDTSRTC